MEIIERVIFNNLVRQQSVLLPRVGMLIVHKESGRFDAQTRRVIAPKLSVEFESDMPEGYPTIINLMMQEGAQRLEDVKSLYEYWVTENCQKSDAGIKIGDVGFARLTSENRYTFEPSKELQDILNPLDNYAIELQAVAKPIAETTDKQPQKTKKKQQTRKWQNIVIIAVAVVALVVWYCFDRYVFSGQDNLTQQSVSQNIQQSVPNKPIKPQQTESQDTIKTKPDTVKKSEPVKEDIKNSGRFCIIAGLYSIEANADHLIETLGDNKKYAEKLPARNGRIYVSVRRFETRQEAETFLNKNRKEHPDYWILETRSNKQ